MSYFCFSCTNAVDLGGSARPGRKDLCDHCNADLHACFNCKFYDSAAYNECRESQAERVVDKDRSNFCDYFVFREGKPGAKDADEKSEQMKKLDDLFK